jgi:hypothetical protein
MAQGADAIFGCGGITGNGAITAAAQAGAYAIGVDTDQYLTLPEAAPRMLSSAMKLITPGVFDLIKLSKEGNFPSGNYFGDAGYAPFHDLDSEVPADVKARWKDQCRSARRLDQDQCSSCKAVSKLRLCLIKRKEACLFPFSFTFREILLI